MGENRLLDDLDVTIINHLVAFNRFRWTMYESYQFVAEESRSYIALN